MKFSTIYKYYIIMKNFYYYFRVAVKVLIPVSFFVIANITKVTNYIIANAIAGVMFILIVMYYILIRNKIGDEKL